MPDYKKKDVKKIKLTDAPKHKKTNKTVKPEKQKIEKKVAVKKPKKNVSAKKAFQKPDEIKIKKKKPTRKLDEVSFNIIKGDMALSFAKRHRTLIIIAFLIIVIFILSFLTPTGLVEFTQNYVASIGSDKMPKNIVGTQIVSADSFDEVHVLTDVTYTLYNKNGKTVMSDKHGFSNPVLRASQARTLVFDQNGTEYKVFNYGGAVINATLKNKIINAAICRNGSYAIVSKPNDYAAKVEVFNKSEKKMFSWSSAQDIITSVCLSNNGKTLVASLLDSVGGELKSKIVIFDFNSAQPVSTIESDSTVLSLKMLNSSTFAAICDDEIIFVDFKKFTQKKIALDGKIEYFRRISSSEFLIASESNKNNLETKLALYNDDFEVESQAIFNGSAEDVTYCDGYFFCLDDNSISKLTAEGKIEKTVTCGYSARRIFTDGSKQVFVVADNNINSYEIGG